MQLSVCWGYNFLFSIDNIEQRGKSAINFKEASTLKEKLSILENKFSFSWTHEVGLFLGYLLLWDVDGFIKNQGKGY
jgi:hypothetical protein